ncbi:TRAP transporter large permease [Aestuariibius sp. 2305UL40-4]|uniref:TRAP transporter large permease n=1 Tax=Aestuariibius violaceus TaxID=3234132 RepID=UPI00345EE011
MTSELIGILGFAGLLLLIGLRFPVGIAMLLVGFIGTGALNSFSSASYSMTGQSFEIISNYDLTVLPLFILMGTLAAAGGLSRNLYDAAQAFIGHWRGGLAGATVVGCAGFAALSGSSIASAVTMGRVAYPQMQRYGYGQRLSTGAIAAGGTLGILIPPSTGFVLYAILTEESIGRLFLAGIIPGLLLTCLFLVAIRVFAAFRPSESPKGERVNWAESFKALLKGMPIVLIILITIGGIYAGLFTPVEAAGIGAFLALVMVILRGQLTPTVTKNVIVDTLQTTGLCFLILIGASVFAPFVALSGLPAAISEWVAGLAIGPYGILAVILVMYLLLGMVIEGLSLMVITLPVVFPLVLQLGFDPIWFGVIMVLVLEMGLISPPVGVNCFVVKTVATDVELETIFAGVFPFLIAMICCVALLVAFPQIALFIPEAAF